MDLYTVGCGLTLPGSPLVRSRPQRRSSLPCRHDSTGRPLSNLKRHVSFVEEYRQCMDRSEENSYPDMTLLVKQTFSGPRDKKE